MVGFLCLPYAFVKLLHSKQLHVTPIIVALVMAVISFSGLMHEVSGMSDAIPSECTKIGADEQPTKMLDGKCYQIRYGLWEDISYRVSKS